MPNHLDTPSFHSCCDVGSVGIGGVNFFYRGPHSYQLYFYFRHTSPFDMLLAGRYNGRLPDGPEIGNGDIRQVSQRPI